MLHSETRGQPTKPALVLLHGWGMSADVWHTWLPQLEVHYHITLIDLPGLGRSVLEPEQVNFTHLTALLAQAIPDNALLLGWSLGGQVAVELAACYPEKARALVLVASNPCFVQREDWPCAMSANVYDMFVSALRKTPEKILQRFIALQVQGAEQSKATLKQLKTVVTASSPSALLETLLLLQEDSRPALASVTCPVLSVLGEADALVPEALQAHWQAQFPSHTVVKIAGAGHVPFISHPDPLTEFLNRFVEALPES